MTNPGFISVKDIKDVYLPMGFSNFKIEGRGVGKCADPGISVVLYDSVRSIRSMSGKRYIWTICWIFL